MNELLTVSNATRKQNPPTGDEEPGTGLLLYWLRFRAFIKEFRFGLSVAHARAAALRG